MRKLLVLIGISAGILSAQEMRLLEPPAAHQNLWRASITAVAVANALDIHSSWGKHELNSTLAGPSGNFGKEGALLKLGFQGGLVGIEYLITRRHPSGKLYRALSFIDFGAAAAIGSVSVHNYTVPQAAAR
ncbi:MAG TPA: hypothetical protein VGH38_02690 [Bryobacteraceae bacterium]